MVTEAIMATDADLLAAVKQHLRMTWNDADRETRLADLIADGKTYFARLAGVDELTFAVGQTERELLLNYVWYGDAGRLDEFEELYLHRLNAFQMDKVAEDGTEPTGP